MNQSDTTTPSRSGQYVMLTLAIQVVGILLMRWYVLQLFAFNRNGVPDSLLTAYILIGAIGVCGVISTLAAIYHTVKRDPPKRVIMLLAFPCLPSLIVSLGYLYAILLFESTI